MEALFLATMALISTCETHVIPILSGERRFSDSQNRPGDFVADGPAISPASRIATQRMSGICLRIAANLPPCNFTTDTDWRARSSGVDRLPETSYISGELPEFINDDANNEILRIRPKARADGTAISSDHHRNFHGDDSNPTLGVIYNLEGCLPSRLPFELPACPIEKSHGVLTYTLVPFRLPSVDYAPLIFPEFDVPVRHGTKTSEIDGDRQNPGTEVREDSDLEGSGTRNVLHEAESIASRRNIASMPSKFARSRDRRVSERGGGKFWKIIRTTVRASRGRLGSIDLWERFDGLRQIFTRLG